MTSVIPGPEQGEGTGIHATAVAFFDSVFMDSGLARYRPRPGTTRHILLRVK
jgi:hypothetical protein